jgi:hypothetical protein
LFVKITYRLNKKGLAITATSAVSYRFVPVLEKMFSLWKLYDRNCGDRVLGGIGVSGRVTILLPNNMRITYEASEALSIPFLKSLINYEREVLGVNTVNEKLWDESGEGSDLWRFGSRKDDTSKNA